MIWDKIWIPIFYQWILMEKKLEHAVYLTVYKNQEFLFTVWYKNCFIFDRNASTPKNHSLINPKVIPMRNYASGVVVTIFCQQSDVGVHNQQFQELIFFIDSLWVTLCKYGHHFPPFCKQIIVTLNTFFVFMIQK